MKKSYRVIYVPKAREEYYEALKYYIERSTSAAYGFEIAIEAVEQLLSEFPEAGTIFDESKNIRSVKVPKYPYRLFYMINDTALEIVGLSIFNTYMDIDDLQDRL